MKKIIVILLCSCIIASNAISAYAEEGMVATDQQETDFVLDNDKATSEELEQADSSDSQSEVGETFEKGPVGESLSDKVLDETNSLGTDWALFLDDTNNDIDNCLDRLDLIPDIEGAELNSVPVDISEVQEAQREISGNDNPEDTMTIQEETQEQPMALGQETVLGKTTETEESEEVVTVDESRKAEANDTRETSEKYRAVIMKAEGGEMCFSATMTLPEKEETEDGNVLDARRFESGTEILLEAVPEDGYELQSVSIISQTNGQETGVQENDGGYTFQMPEDSVVIRPVFSVAQLETTDEWYTHFAYELDEDLLRIRISSFDDSYTDVVMPAVAIINGKEYTTALVNNVFTDTNVESVVFEDDIIIENGNSLFSGCRNLKTVAFNNVDTSEAIQMDSMFSNCVSLEMLDLSNFDTSSVVSMEFMFNGCSSLKALNTSSFDTSNVESMRGMFRYIGLGGDINLSHFNTSNVYDMSYMFQGLAANSLNISGFITTNVTTMSSMFSNTQLVSIIGLNGFNTENVVTMDNMFFGAKANNIDVSSFDTSKVTNMSYMFTGTKARNLLLSDFDTGNVTNREFMFSQSAAEYLDLRSFDTSSVTNMRYMFYAASAKSINLESFNTENVTTMESMFENAAVSSLDLSSFNTGKVTNMSSLFRGSDISIINGLDAFITSNVTKMDAMFFECSSLQSIDLSSFDTSSVSTFDWMFSKASELQKIDISGFAIPNNASVSELFYYCLNLREVHIPKLNVIPDRTFRNCNNLSDLYYSGTKSQWGDLVSNGYSTGNEILANVTVHCIDGVFIPNGGYVVDQDLIDVVSRYTTGTEAREVTEILRKYPDTATRHRKLMEYYHYDNLLDVSDRIKTLSATHDERWDYIGLMQDDMYLAWQYYDYLNNTPKGVAARTCLYASGLVFNGELKDWVDLETYLNAELPGIKKYKAMLEDFIKDEKASIELRAYVKEAKSFVQDSVNLFTESEKLEFLKKIKRFNTPYELKSELNNFVATKIKNGKGKIEFDITPGKEKPAFIEAMDKVGKVFEISDITLEFVSDFLDVSANLEAYKIYHDFLEEIYTSSDIPWEMQAAAYILDDELKNGYYTPFVNALNSVLDFCIDNALREADIRLVPDLFTLSISSTIINQFVNVGVLVQNSCKTEGYVLLTNHYRDKLRDCERAFLANKTEQNAWNFYEAYTMLWKLRMAGEKQFLSMSRLEGGTIVDGLQSAISQNTIAGMISDIFNYADKEAAVQENLDMLQGFEFSYTPKSIPESKKYVMKATISCPVCVDVFDNNGNLICSIPDQTSTEIWNDDYGYVSFYTATTGEYTKIFYSNGLEPFAIKITGSDEGVVDYTLTKDLGDSLSSYGFYDIPVSVGTKINTTSDNNTYTVDYSSTGDTVVEGEQGDKDRVFVQFDYQDGNTIKVEYVNDNGTVNLPQEIQIEGKEFEGWFMDPDNQNNPFTENTVVSENKTVYAHWRSKGSTEAIAVMGIDIDTEAIVVFVNDEVLLRARLMPDDATNTNITWSSDNELVAKVADDGTVTGLSKGIATITATTEDGGYTATCMVTVNDPEPATVSVTGISLNKASLSMKKGETTTLAATVSPGNATNKSVSWATSNKNVCTVSGGTVKAVGKGKATITVTTADGNKKASCTVTVSDPKDSVVHVTGISISKKTLSLKKGEKAKLTSTITPADATNKSVQWTSSNPSVATVSSDGTVTGKAKGTAIIAVASVESNQIASCTVTVTEAGDPGAPTPVMNGWYTENGKKYWYENGVRQGTYSDKKGVIGDGTIRGREIYDPGSDGWYWLDAVYDGAKAVGKEVWMPYIYQDEDSWDSDTKWRIAQESDPGMADCVYNAIQNKTGKWVRYDENGRMLKGWVTIEGELARHYPAQAGNTYYYDHRTGLMAKGEVTIDGASYRFDEVTGALIGSRR